MFPSASPRGTLGVSGKQNSLFPLGPVIKCLMSTSDADDTFVAVTYVLSMSQAPGRSDPNFIFECLIDIRNTLK